MQSRIGSAGAAHRKRRPPAKREPGKHEIAAAAWLPEAIEGKAKAPVVAAREVRGGRNAVRCVGAIRANKGTSPTPNVSRR
jgi:hypothetical protein